MQSKASRQALKLTLIYIIVAGGWILITGKLVELLIPNSDVRNEIEIFNGCIFVLVTGGLLLLMVRRLLSNWEQEVEQRKEILEKLSESEQRFRILFEQAIDGMLLADVKTKHILLGNRVIQEMLGYSENELLRLAVKDIHPADDLPAVLDQFARQARGETRLISDVPMRRKDGSVFYADINASPIRLRQRHCMFGIFRDNTERKRAEAALRESEEKFRSLFNNAQVGMFRSRLDGSELLDANETFLSMLGRTREETVAKPSLSLWADSRERKKMVGLLEAENSSGAFECKLLKKTGEAMDCLTSLTFYPETGILEGSVIDITDRKRAEEALHNREQRLRLMVEQFPVVAWTTDTALILTSVSGSALADLGIRGEDLVGQNYGELYGQDSVRTKAHRDALRGNSCKYDVQVGSRDFEACVTPLRDAGQKIIGCIGVAVDITVRKQAERRIVEATNYTQTLLAASPIGVITYRADGQMVSANAAAARLVGTTDENLKKQNFRELESWKKSKLFERAELALATGQEQSFEEHVESSHGNALWLSVRFVPFRYEGDPHLLLLMQDITERKLAEEANARLAGIVEFSTDAIIGKDLHGIIQSWNKGAEKIFGYSPEEMIGSSIHKLIPLDRHEEEEMLLRQVLRGESVEHYETFRQSKDGRLIPISITVSPIKDHAGKIVGASKVARDITERKRAEEQMRLQFSALTAAANTIVITDRSGKIEWVNPAFTKLTGYSAEEAVGGKLSLLKSGRHSEEFYANLWASILTGNVWHGEMINKRKDGRLYTEEMTITPVRGADGEFAHFVAIKHDVTERRGLELQLQQAQKMEAIGTLAGGIAHDFNNILAAMFGYGYLLKQDILEQPAQEYIGEILKAANRAKDLVQQILTFSRQREFDRHIIQLHTVVKEAMKFLRASLPANIKIETHFAPDTPAVLADPTQIYQVITNLATNALHAMEDGPGQLTVRIEPFQPDDAFLGLHPELKPIPYARLTVADTGHGIDAVTLERIFEPFFTTKPLGKGTGLGLSVVHGILQAHEGVITVETEVGRGTTFALYFPGRTKDADQNEAGAKSAPGGRGQKILLLDDEPALTTVMQSLLVRLNYQVTTSNRARDAIGLCRENPARFDLVITDLTMPEVNGLEVARQIRAIHPGMPVVLTSGLSVDLSREDLMAAGICELLKKPIDMNQLAEAIQRALINPDRRTPPAQQP